MQNIFYWFDNEATGFKPEKDFHHYFHLASSVVLSKVANKKSQDEDSAEGSRMLLVE